MFHLSSNVDYLGFCRPRLVISVTLTEYLLCSKQDLTMSNCDGTARKGWAQGRRASLLGGRLGAGSGGAEGVHVESARRAVSEWPLWDLPRWLQVLVTGVIALYLGA